MVNGEYFLRSPRVSFTQRRKEQQLLTPYTLRLIPYTISFYLNSRPPAPQSSVVFRAIRTADCGVAAQSRLRGSHPGWFYR